MLTEWKAYKNYMNFFDYGLIQLSHPGSLTDLVRHVAF